MRNWGKKGIICLLSIMVGCSLLLSGCGLGKMVREHQAAQGGPVELKLAYHVDHKTRPAFANLEKTDTAFLATVVAKF